MNVILAFLDKYSLKGVMILLLVVYHEIAAWFVWRAAYKAIYEFFVRRARHSKSRAEDLADYYCFLYLTQFTLFPVPLIARGNEWLVRVWKRIRRRGGKRDV